MQKIFAAIFLLLAFVAQSELIAGPNEAPPILKTADAAKKDSTAVQQDFFAGTKYTDKVVSQMGSGDFHAFPENVKAFQASGTVSKITGGDGVTRDMLRIPGSYEGKTGYFEFIKEPDGSINHRLFRPDK